MLQSLLAERMRQNRLSARDTARQIGVSHTTVIRLLNGDTPNIENLMAVSQWLGVSLATALGVESGTADNIAARMAMIMEAEPRLKELFSHIVGDYQKGDLTNDDIEDILAYAAFRLRKKDKLGDDVKSQNALPGGN